MRKLLPSVASWILSFALALSLCPLPIRADSESGIIIMSHGGDSQWNKTVKKAVKEADLPYPYKIFYGMGDSAVNSRNNSKRWLRIWKMRARTMCMSYRF